MEWPSQSPDLNITENVWHKIKHELQKHVQNITSRQLLETAIRNIIYINLRKPLLKSKIHGCRICGQGQGGNLALSTLKSTVQNHQQFKKRLNI